MATNDERMQQGGGAEEEHPAKRVEEDHRTLRGQLDAIAAAATPASLLSDLLAMPKMLLEQFALEEQSGGLYDDLRTRCPSLTDELNALCEEHRVILEEFDALCGQLKGRAGAEQSGDEIDDTMKRDVASWLARLRRHERQESCMIGDVYYTDEGGYG